MSELSNNPMVYGREGPGGVDNYQMFLDAKAKPISRSGIDLTTANVVYIGEYPQTDVEVLTATLRLEDSALTGNCGIQLGIGPLVAGAVPDPDGIGTVAAAASGSAEGQEFSFTLATTLAGTGNRRGSKGKPVIPAGTPIYATVDGVPSAGNGAIVLNVMPLDNNLS